jgi:hypothetical protein
VLVEAYVVLSCVIFHHRFSLSSRSALSPHLIIIIISPHTLKPSVCTVRPTSRAGVCGKDLHQRRLTVHTSLSFLFFTPLLPVMRPTSPFPTLSHPFPLPFLALLFLLLTLIPSPTLSLNLFIGANEEECFFESLDQGEKLYSSFSVQSGGYQDIDVKVYGPDLRLVYEQDRAREGTFQFKAVSAGPHRLCFSNSMSTVSGKTVSFNLYTGHSLLPLDAAKQAHLTPLEQQIVQVSEGVYSVHDTQVYLKYREVRHSATLESTHSRVLWWGLLELMSLVSVSVFNILYLRQLFERSGKR